MIGKDELAEAARYNDARSEEFADLEPIFADLRIDTRGAFYVAEQRALRLYALFTKQLPALQRGEAIRIDDRDVFNMLLVGVIDGIAIAGTAIALSSRTSGDETQ